MRKCKSAIYSGKAYEKFLQVVARQGGDISFVEHPQKYPAAKHSVEVASPEGGYVTGFETMQIGLLGIELGAGRKKVGDVIDPEAGIVFRKKIGERVEAAEVIATLFSNKADSLHDASSRLRSFVHIGKSPVSSPPLIHAYLDAEGTKPWNSPTPY
jgi:pyrimidine-nucleoside phosphorylase